MSCPEFRRINVSDLVSAGLAVTGSLKLPSMGREGSQEFEHHAQLCSKYSCPIYGGTAGPAVVAASAVLPEADCLQGWYGSVNLLNDVCHHSEECTKVRMRQKCSFLPEPT